jgi:tryptophan synthase alpha subunit
MKKLLKNKAFVSGLFSVVLVGFGVANPEVAAQWGANIYCGVVVKCDA